MTAKFLIENGSDRETLSEELRAELLIRGMTRLRQMEDYCKMNRCYRAALLDYFGEPHAPSCTNCGNCRQTEYSLDGETVEEDVTLAAQKILSCVRRVEQRNRVGLGETMIVRILTGSREKTLLAREYDLLPTYGIMKGTNRNLLREYVQVLVKQGYLLRPPGDYDVLQTTERANGVLFHGEKVLWRHEAAKPEKKPVTASVEKANASQSLFDRLRAMRAELARQAGVPAYVIFHDATLLSIAAEKPTTEAALLAVPGIGERRQALSMSAAFLFQYSRRLNRPENSCKHRHSHAGWELGQG